MKRLVTIALLTGLLQTGLAQDIHFSQFWASPMNINPSFTGQFDGDYRFIGNYRTQWKSVTVPYTTFGLSADAHNLLEMEDVGAGINFFYDQAGDSRFKTVHLNLAGSYTFHLDEDSLHHVAVGIQTGITNRNIDYSDLRFDNQYNGLFYDANLPHNEVFSRESRTYLNLNLGGTYFYTWDKRKMVSAGLGLYNLTKPQQSFFNNTDILLDMRMNFHLKGQYMITDEIDLLPGVLWSRQGKMQELLVGSSMRYILQDQPGAYRAVYAGLWMRNKDAGYLHLGMDYDDWNVGVSYDLNFSGLVPASNARGGLELSVIYIIRTWHPERVKHRVCPNFI